MLYAVISLHGLAKMDRIKGLEKNKGFRDMIMENEASYGDYLAKDFVHYKIQHDSVPGSADCLGLDLSNSV